LNLLQSGAGFSTTRLDTNQSSEFRHLKVDYGRIVTLSETLTGMVLS